jgi:small conductance mechanosensitive channel
VQLIESIFIKLQAYFSIDRFGDLLSGLFVKVVIFVLVLIVFYILWWLLSRLIESTLNRRFDKTSASFASILIKICLFGIGFIVALSAAGVETAALLGSLGVVGLTLGFALKDVISNIISGVLLHMDRPFTVDDLVEVDGKYGRVDLITLRTTRIVTNDGKMVAVPNAEVMNKTVVSYTNFPHLRLDISVCVGVSEDLDNARRLLLSQVENDTDYMTTPSPAVVVTQLNDYNVELELQAWITNERKHIKKAYELRERIFKSFTAAGIEMPCETIQLAKHTVNVKMSNK